MDQQENSSKVTKWALPTLILFFCAGLLISRHLLSKDFYLLKTSLNRVQKIKAMNVALDDWVLKSRFYYLEYYDPIVKEIDQAKNAIIKLETLATPGGSYKKSFDKIKGLFEKKRQLIESFKSQNAIYKNSERYMPVLLDEIYQKTSSAPSSQARKQAIEKMSTLLLNYMARPSGEQRQRLQGLHQTLLEKSMEEDKAVIRQLGSHLNVILTVGLELDQLVGVITTDSIALELNNLARLISDDLVRHEKQANIYYGLMFVLCAALVGLVGVTLIKLHRANDGLEKKVAERTRELASEKEAAQEAARTKARFLANMSHEIRTPMNAVLSCTDLLLDKISNPENVRLAKTISSSGVTLLRIINDILDFSKIESGKLELENEPFCLPESLKETVDLLGPKASAAKTTLWLKLHPEIPNWVDGDVTRFRQVLINLIGNAVKFTRNKVNVEVTSKHLGGGRHEIQVAVIDNGMGIADEAKERLFQDFSQIDASTTRKFGGTGLGLAICKGLTTAMGGKIWFRSQLEAGSEFYFTIVVVECEAPETADMPQISKIDADMGKNHPLKVLLAEDNSINQMVAQAMIAKIGYDVDIVKNGLEAVSAVKSTQYDVVLMDQHMPEMDGVEATIEIRKFAKETPRIYALTASVFKEDKVRCLEAGMNGFLTKPIDIGEIVTAFYECKPRGGMIYGESQDQELDDAEERKRA